MEYPIYLTTTFLTACFEKRRVIHSCVGALLRVSATVRSESRRWTALSAVPPRTWQSCQSGPDQLLCSWDPTRTISLGFSFFFLSFSCFFFFFTLFREGYLCPPVNNLKEVSSSSSSSPSATSVITLICSKNIHMADSLRHGGIFDLTKEGSACLRAMTSFFFPLSPPPLYVRGLKISSISVFTFGAICLGERNAKRDFQLCFFLLCQPTGRLRGD